MWWISLKNVTEVRVQKELGTWSLKERVEVVVRKNIARAPFRMLPPCRRARLFQIPSTFDISFTGKSGGGQSAGRSGDQLTRVSSWHYKLIQYYFSLFKWLLLDCRCLPFPIVCANGSATLKYYVSYSLNTESPAFSLFHRGECIFNSLCNAKEALLMCTDTVFEFCTQLFGAMCHVARGPPCRPRSALSGYIQ